MHIYRLKLEKGELKIVRSFLNMIIFDKVILKENSQVTYNVWEAYNSNKIWLYDELDNRHVIGKVFLTNDLFKYTYGITVENEGKHLYVPKVHFNKTEFYDRYIDKNKPISLCISGYQPGHKTPEYIPIKEYYQKEYDVDKNFQIEPKKARDLINSKDSESRLLGSTLIRLSNYTSIEKEILLGNLQPSRLKDSQLSNLSPEIFNFCRDIVIQNIKEGFPVQIKRFDIKIE